MEVYAVRFREVGEPIDRARVEFLDSFRGAIRGEAAVRDPGAVHWCQLSHA